MAKKLTIRDLQYATQQAIDEGYVCDDAEIHIRGSEIIAVDMDGDIAVLGYVSED